MAEFGWAVPRSRSLLMRSRTGLCRLGAPRRSGRAGVRTSLWVSTGPVWAPSPEHRPTSARTSLASRGGPKRLVGMSRLGDRVSRIVLPPTGFPTLRPQEL